MKTLLAFVCILISVIPSFGQANFKASSTDKALEKIRKLDQKTHIFKCAEVTNNKNRIFFVQSFSPNKEEGKYCPVLKLAETTDGKNYEVKTLFSFNKNMFLLNTCTLHFFDADNDAEPEIFLRCKGEVPESGDPWEWVTPLDDMKTVGKDGLPFPSFIPIIQKNWNTTAFMINTPEGTDPLVQIKAALASYGIIK